MSNINLKMFKTRLFIKWIPLKPIGALSRFFAKPKILSLQFQDKNVFLQAVIGTLNKL